jgi:hypothetical protein
VTQPTYDRSHLLKILRESSIVREPRDRSDGRAVFIVGYLVWASGFLVLLAVVFLGSQDVGDDYSIPGLIARRDHAAAMTIYSVLPIVFISAGWAVGVYLMNKGRRLQTPDVFAELDRLPDRRPILFLRSFCRDNTEGFFKFRTTTGDSFEMAVANEMRKLGPVIAVGKPGEALPPIGAARFYIGDEHWKPTITEVLAASQFIVLVYGSTAGLLWEIEQIIKAEDPSKLIICIPKHRNLRREQASWQEFRESTRHIFPQPLPESVESSLFLRFQESWEPVLVGDDGSRVGRRAIRKGLQACIAPDS